MDINKLKQANEIFQSLSSNTIDEAMEELKTFDDIEYEVLKLVKSLINNSQHSDTRFDADIGQPFQSALNKEWQEGDEVDGYKLIELIGQGGMSVVFKAQRINNDAQKPVAIKLFNLVNQNPELKKRFQREQRILSELSHPNVIDFHHGESTEHGDSFIVMELINKGLPIDEYIKGNQRSNKQIVDLLIQAAQGLHYAHKHLVVHLDVKPSNLMVDDSGQLKVLDFGIAKLINPDVDVLGESQAHHTMVALTPTFASPEQIKVQRIDTSSDVFSLAAVAVFLLTGKQPFPANRLLNQASNDEAHVTKLLKTHLMDKDLRHVLLKALREDRKLRYQDMNAFSQDLRDWQMKKPVTASKNTWWYRLNRFVVRRTALFVTSVLLLLSVIIGVSLLAVQNQATKLEAEKANAVKQFMLDAFSVTDPDSAQGVDLSARELLLSASNKIKADQFMDKAIKFELYMAMALANGRLGYYPEAIKLLQTGLLIEPKSEEATTLLAEYLLSFADMDNLTPLLSEINENSYASLEMRIKVMRVRAVVAAEAGEYDKAFEIQKKIAVLDLSQEEYIVNQALLAEIYFLKGEGVKSVEIIEAVKNNHSLPTTHTLNIGLNSDLVQYHDRNNNFKAAMSLTLENIKIFRTILGESHPDLGLAYNSLSAFQWLDGQLNESLKSSAIAEQIFRKRYGDSSEGLAQSLSNTGLVYYYQKKYDLAIEKLSQATNMLAEIFGKDHPETMNAKGNYATILNAIGRPEKALPILQEMYELQSSTLGKSDRSSLYTQQSLALTLSNSGFDDEAINHATESQKLFFEHFTSQENLTHHTFSVLARVYFKAGKHKLALENNLIHINEWKEGNENNLAQSFLLVAKSYFELKDLDASFEYFQLWTEKLEKLYQETDVKYLGAQLLVVEYAQRAGWDELSEKLLIHVSDVINDNELLLPEITDKLEELSQ